MSIDLDNPGEHAEWARIIEAKTAENALLRRQCNALLDERKRSAVNAHRIAEANDRGRNALIEQLRLIEKKLDERNERKNAILVWAFPNAPAEFRALSPHGGDEDFVAVLPRSAARPSWAYAGGPFGSCDVSEHALPDGRIVLIGAHA